MLTETVYLKIKNIKMQILYFDFLRQIIYEKYFITFFFNYFYIAHQIRSCVVRSLIKINPLEETGSSKSHFQS